MPNRDRKACNKAVAAAWKKERQLVLEGKGTRDWTEEQQLEIIELGKAFDDDGIAFEGQHMKSVEAYPEYQGDSENIQLLSKAEHLAAHKGDFRNPTNWYYNPKTTEFFDFEDNGPVPCETISLKNPIAIEQENNPSDKALNENDENTSGNSSYSPSNEYSVGSSYDEEKPDGFWGWLEYQWEEAKKHPWKTILKIGGAGLAIFGGYKGGKAIKNHFSQKNGSNFVPPHSSYPRQMPPSHGLTQTVARDIGKKIQENVQQTDVTSTITKQVLDVSTKAIEGLNNYSVLLTKGYNTNISQEARQKILENALAENGKQSIVRLLRFLISTRSGNKLGKYEKAIAVWQEDLDFILKK